jgi:hypothetical protein
MEDLWPEGLTQTKIKPTIAILRQQASLLGPKTDNLVVADTEIMRSRFRPEPNSFRYAFIIRAPTLEDYRHRLFSISHDIRLYPVIFHLDREFRAELGVEPEATIEVSSETELKEILARVLQAEKTIRIIQAILAQSLDTQMEDDTEEEVVSGEQ